MSSVWSAKRWPKREVLLKNGPAYRLPDALSPTASPPASAPGMDDPYRLVYVPIIWANAPASRDPPGCVLAQNLVLKPEIVRGFEYSGLLGRRCPPGAGQRRWSSAKAAKCVPAPALLSAKRENGLWVVEAEDIDSGEKFTGRRAAAWSMPPAHGSNSSSTKGCICARLTASV